MGHGNASLQSFICASLVLPEWQAEDEIISGPDAATTAANRYIIFVGVQSQRKWRQTAVATDTKKVKISTPNGVSAFVSGMLIARSGDKPAPVSLIYEGGVQSERARHVPLNNSSTGVNDIPPGMIGRPSPGLR